MQRLCGSCQSMGSLKGRNNMRVASALAALATALIANSVSAEPVLRTQVYPGSIISLPVWVADDGGFCKAEGISCPAVPIASGPLGLQAVAAGSLEVMFTSTDIIMQAASRGNDVIVITGHSPNNIYELTIRKDVGLKEKAYPEVMKQFVGKTVGISARGSAVENQMRALLVGAGLSPDAVTYVAVGSPNTAYPAMLAKQIEAAVMWVPFQSICEAKGICEVAVDMKNGEGPANLKALNGAFETFAARRDFVKANKEAIDKFITAMGKGIEWMKKPENYDKVREIAKKHTSLGDLANSDTILTDLVKSQVLSYSSKVDRQAIKGFANFLVDIKLTPKPFDTSNFVYEGSP